MTRPNTTQTAIARFLDRMAGRQITANDLALNAKLTPQGAREAIRDLTRSGRLKQVVTARGGGKPAIYVVTGAKK